MRFLSILITLSIIGYAISIYIKPGALHESDPDKAMSKPKEFIDHSSQAVDQINESLKKRKKTLDNLN
jgi:hypothetical protein